MKCRYCSKSCIKKGKARNHQRYRCTDCHKYQQQTYTYHSHLVNDSEIVNLVKEGCGIRSTARLLQMFTYIGNKNNRVCIAYSLNAETREIIDIVVGKRNKSNLKRIISTLILSEAKQIATDKLNIYKELIPKQIHSTKNRGINYIERQNLNLRTHLKRLNRRTICYSKSASMLLAVVKIYFWS